MNYYISRSGQQYGPYALADIENMLAQSQIEPTDHAWAEGMPEWKPVSEIVSKAAPPAPEPVRAPAPVIEPAAVQQPPILFEPPPQQPVQHPPTQFEQAPPIYPPQPQYSPQPQPDYAAQPPYQQPPPAFVPAPMAAQPYGGGPPQPVSGAVPPSMHWFVLLLLGTLTFGILMYIWFFVQAGFVKKIDPRSKAGLWFALYLLMALATLGAFGYTIYELHIDFSEMKNPEYVQLVANAFYAYLQTNMALLLTCSIAAPLSFIFLLVGIFGMRSSIQRYYNNVEPIGLRLSGVMTFFFNILYFQYHFRRIARWKETGQLS